MISSLIGSTSSRTYSSSKVTIKLSLVSSNNQLVHGESTSKHLKIEVPQDTPLQYILRYAQE